MKSIDAMPKKPDGRSSQLSEANKKLTLVIEKIQEVHFAHDDYVKVDLNESHLNWKIENH